MKTWTAAVGILASSVLGLANPSLAVAAGPARSMAALEARLEPGTQIDVVDREGKMVRGDFVRADDRGVLIAGYAGTPGNLVTAADVVSVTRAGDPVKNGMLIGAAVGLVSAIVVATDDSGDSGCYTTGCRVGLGIVVVPIYTGIGALIDKAVKGREIVYRAPPEGVSWSITPRPVPRGAGLQVALRF